MALLSGAFRSAYDVAFQVSPIIFTGGIVGGSGPVPVISLVGQLAGFAQGALTSGALSTNDAWARFVPLAGTSVIENTIGQYPFANQNVAANAIIRQPLNIGMQMIVPIKDAGGYLTKLALFTALQQSFVSHNAAGGTYTIATPSYIYTGCIMLSMTDITAGETRQQQVVWQLMFQQPLTTQAELNGSLNSVMAAIDSGQATTGALTATGSLISGILPQLSTVTQPLEGGISL